MGNQNRIHVADRDVRKQRLVSGIPRINKQDKPIMLNQISATTPILLGITPSPTKHSDTHAPPYERTALLRNP
ncbi:hypothetical protein GCM10010436_95610 [Paractinoplanes durhamensis]